MASTVWKGHLSFGLVSIPVRLVRAARAERVPLRQLYRASRPAPQERIEPVAKGKSQPLLTTPEPLPALAPVERSFQVANGGGQPVSSADLVKGYEYSKGEYVVLEEEEIRAAAPQTSTEMQIVEFVPFSEIDPVYLETSYYVAPDESGEKSYALLFAAMQDSGYAAIGQLTMHRRDHVMIVRPGKTGLIAHTMFHTTEVRTLDEFRTDVKLVSAKELDLARTLIQALATSFEPGKFKNQFQERLRSLIESRSSTRQPAAVQPAATPSNIVDILDALKRSLASVSKPAAAAERKPAQPEPSTKKIRARGAR